MQLKALILAAGEGSRLQPFSRREYPKILFKFRGKPLIFYHIDELLHNKIDNIVVVCNPQNKKLVEEMIKKEYPNLKVYFTIQAKQLGPSQAVYSARQALRDTDFFLLIYSDSFSYFPEFKMLLNLFRQDPQDGTIFLIKVKDWRRFGIARFQGERIVEIIEKPQSNPPSNLAWRGACILKRENFFQGFTQRQSSQDKKEIAPPEYVLRAKGKLNYRLVSFLKLDLGYPWDILTFNRVMLDQFGGKILTKKVGKGVKISPKSYIDPKTVLEDGVKIGDYVSLEEAYVGRNAILEDSYVMEGVKIGEGSQIQKSVIGRDVEIGPHFVTKTRSQEKIKIFVKGEYKEMPLKRIGCFLGPKVKVASNLFSRAGKVVYSGKEVNKNIVQDILPPRAIFFDADNTLYPTHKTAPRADKKAMAYLAAGSPYSPQELYDFWLQKIVAEVKESKNPKERSRQYSYKKLIQKYHLAKDARKAFSIFRKELVKYLKPYPYLEPTLKKLKHYLKVVISEDNQDLIRFKLESLGLKKYFDLVVAAEEVGIMKPSPRYFQYTLKKLNLFPQEVVVIGDDWEKDLAEAYKLGMRTIIFGKEDQRAHRSIRSFAQLPQILEII